LSSAVAAAEVAALVEQGTIRTTHTVVAVITGSGLRQVGAVGAAPRTRLRPEASPAELDRILPPEALPSRGSGLTAPRGVY
jgi:threonine synthase